MKRFLLMSLCVIFCLTSFRAEVYGVNADVSDRESIRMAYKARIISREQFVISSIKAAFTKSDSSAASKSSDTGSGSRELTMLFKEAVENYPAYSDESKAWVDRFLFRPDSATNNWPWPPGPYFYLPEPVSVFSPSELDYPNIGGRYTFWYVTHSTPDSAGVVHAVTPEFVAAVVQAFETSYATTVADMGFMAPLSDLGYPDNGGDEKRDVYLMNCGAYDIYGYTMPLPGGTSTSSFMVVDNDFVEFATPTVTAMEAMQVTVAHEFHHGVQFSINSYADAWIMEATSAWIESQVYPDVEDNLQYLNDDSGFFALPHVPLDDDLQWYNAWIFLEYLTIKWGDNTVKTLWDYIVENPDGITAVSLMLDVLGSDLKTSFTEFAQKNYSQTDFYPRAEEFNEVYIANGVGQTLDNSSVSTRSILTASPTVDHLAAMYYKFIPGESLVENDGNSLLVYVNGDDGKSLQATLTVKHPGGSYTEHIIALDDQNKGYLYVDDFYPDATDEVVLELINYSMTDDDLGVTVSGGLRLAAVASGDGGSGSGGCFVESGLR